MSYHWEPRMGLFLVTFIGCWTPLMLHFAGVLAPRPWSLIVSYTLASPIGWLAVYGIIAGLVAIPGAIRREREVRALMREYKGRVR